MSKSWYPTPGNPFADALGSVIGEKVPDDIDLSGAWCFNDIKGEDAKEDLHNWCSVNCRPFWATGLSMIEAAELSV